MGLSVLVEQRVLRVLAGEQSDNVDVRAVLRGLSCTHRRMEECCPGCGHLYCPDCGLEWDSFGEH